MKCGPALYIAAEGAHGIPERIDAWKAQNHVIGDPKAISFYPEAVNLIDATETEIAAVVTYVAEHRPVLVVVDTYARSLLGGDENSGQDAG